MKISMIIVAVSLGYASANCTQSFRLSNRTTEACEGVDLVYECSIEGNGTTVFEGDLLNCTNADDDIPLLHSRFNNGTSGTCNNETILGYSLPVNDSGNCYTSLLCITVSPDMVGKTIRCVHDNGTRVKEIGNFSIPPTCNTMATITPITATSNFVQRVEDITSDPMHTTNSLSSGEVETIIICCSVFLVGFIIIVIILSIFGFVFKKKRLQAVQTLNNVHTSSAHIRQETEPMFHCAQNKEVSGYTLCTMDYDRVIIVTDDSEYSHLQHPGPQHALGIKSTALL